MPPTPGHPDRRTPSARSSPVCSWCSPQWSATAGCAGACEVTVVKRLIFLVAFAAGYVAGSAAGRERYLQIRRVALRVKDDPRVQQKAHEAAEFAKEHAQGAAEKAK